MKTRPVGAKLFHADGQTETKLRVAFCNFADTHVNWVMIVGSQVSDTNNTEWRTKSRPAVS